MQVERIDFPNGNQALCVKAPEEADAQSVIAALELPTPRALLIINGGTAKLDEQVSQSLSKFFAAVARTVIDDRITVITGATNAGIFTLFGRALEKAGRLSAPCIGVTAAGQVSAKDLEPHHSHFVLVDVEEWSEATPFMYRLIAALASACPSLALFASGGEITLDEMRENIAQQREMILLAGSSGNSDAVAAARAGEPVEEEALRHIARYERLKVFELGQPPTALANFIRSRLLSV